MLSQPCPFGLRAWKAGRHQREQTGVPSNVADYFEVVVKAAKDKIKAAGEAVFTDNEVWGLVQRSGLKPEQKEKDIRSATSDLTPAETEKRMEELVSGMQISSGCRDGIYLFFCRDTTPSTPGLPSPGLRATWWRPYRSTSCSSSVTCCSDWTGLSGSCGDSRGVSAHCCPVRTWRLPG